MKVLSWGDRIRPGAYAVRARFARSVLLLDASHRALFVVDRSIGPGPLNLVVDSPAAFVPAESLPLPPPPAHAPVFDSSLPRLTPETRARLLRTLQTALPRHAPPESLLSLFSPAKNPPRLQTARDALFRDALAHLNAGRLADGARLIRGCGEGLTPSGDDFLCGWMLTLRLRRRTAPLPTILQNALGLNPVSNAFLEMAAQGRVNIALQRLLQAPSPARVRNVCAFGHTSGADLLCGMRYGLQPLTPASTRRSGSTRSGTTRTPRACGAK